MSIRFQHSLGRLFVFAIVIMALFTLFGCEATRITLAKCDRTLDAAPDTVALFVQTDTFDPCLRYWQERMGPDFRIAEDSTP